MSRQSVTSSMHFLSRLLMMLSTLLTMQTATAEDYGRYRAIVLHVGGHTGKSGSLLPKVFIIDSKDGHMWTWEQKTKLQRRKKNFELGNILTYQGQVRPGKKMGEIVDQAPSK